MLGTPVVRDALVRDALVATARWLACAVNNIIAEKQNIPVFATDEVRS